MFNRETADHEYMLLFADFNAMHLQNSVPDIVKFYSGELNSGIDWHY